MKRQVTALLVALAVMSPFPSGGSTYAKELVHPKHCKPHIERNCSEREQLIYDALAEKHWPTQRSDEVVHTTIILAKYIAEHRYAWREGQWVALKQLWSHESGFWYRNIAPSGACGVPQFLPCSKGGPGFMASPVIQIRKGLLYIDENYGSPLAACQGSCGSGSY